MAREKTTKGVVEISRLERRKVVLYIVGDTPLVMNRLAEKARQELLLPRRSMNKAARADSLKHNPPEEFRSSVYRNRDSNAPTAVHIPNEALKKAMASAALDIPGATKTEIGRLVQVIDATVFVYGIPYLYMDVVRLLGFQKVPDIRTRAMFPEWCLKVTIQYIGNNIRESDVVNLLDAAGVTIGVGDGRPEKGTRLNGCWRLVQSDDADWHRIAKTQGRKAQEAALAKPVAVNADTEELFAWFQEEMILREKDPAGKRTPRTNGTRKPADDHATA